MAVTAARAREASRGALEEEWDTMERRIALRERAREVREVSRATVARSRLLKAVIEQWRCETLARRCAGCGRYYVRDSWVSLRPKPHSNRTTHTVCDFCGEARRAARLRA